MQLKSDIGFGSIQKLITWLLGESVKLPIFPI